MADGKVVIDVILDDGTVAKGVANIDKQLGGLAGAGKRAAIGIKEIVTSLGLVTLAAKAIDMVKNSLDGAISRYDTLNNFPRVLQLMGFDAKQSKKAIDELSDGIDGLPTTLDSVAKTTQRLALMTGDLKGATKTTISLNNAFLASGASAADAERGLEQYVQMLSTGTVDLESWRTLQETMPIALNKTADAFGFAGKSAQNDLYNALKSGEITFEDFNNKLVELNDGVGGFAELARKSTGGIATSWQNMKTAVVKGVADVIGAIDKALGSFGGIAGIFDGLKVGVQTVFNWIVASIPVVAEWIGIIVDKIREWLPPMDEIKNGFINAFQTIRDFVTPIVQEIVDFIMSVWGGLVSWWQENGEQIMQAVQNAFEFIKGVIEFVMPAVQFIIEIVWAAIKDIIGGALDIIMGLIQVFTGIFTGDWSQLWEGIKKILGGAVDLILGIMSLNFLGGIKKAFTSMFETSVNTVKNMWAKIVEFFKTFTDDAASKVSGMASKVWEFAKNMATNFINTISNLKNNVVNKFSEIKNGIIDKVKSIDLKDIGKNIIQGLINGIGSMASAVVDKVKSIGKSISNGFKNALGIHSPSKVMADIAKWIPEGIGVGIERNEKSAIKSLQGLTDNLVSNIQPEIAVTNRMRGFRPSLGNLVPTATTAGGNIQNVFSNNGSNQKFINLVNAIRELSKRPISVQVDGREIVYATVDEMREVLEFKKNIENRFRG
ncbi:tape measure protein [Caldifermentibacillus hisashii]|uniref:phage tail protein n=1 Tax=Caldifermentibacillus hisashii TaxID=996558 RepID=UPI0031B6D44D